MLGHLDADELAAAGKKYQEVLDATRRYESESEFDPALPDRTIVSQTVPSAVRGRATQ